MENYNQLINKAKSFYKLNEFENSKNCLLEVIKNFKLDTKVKSNIFLLLADLFSKLNSFKDVEKYLLKYLEIHPNNSAAFKTFSVPKMFVFTASKGKNSHDGTCFNAAA